MWIDELELASFGGVSGEKIVFKNDKLNLVVEANEYGKSTIAKAISFVLYNFSGNRLTELEALRPHGSSSLPYAVAMNVRCKDRSLRIVRDFASNTVRILDRQRNDTDVTHEFLAEGGNEVGLKLTGLSLELFLATCFVGQRELNKHAVATQKLRSLFQSMSDSSYACRTAATAIDVLNGSLKQFLNGGNKIETETIMPQLEAEYDSLSERQKVLKEERKQASEYLKRMSDLNLQLSRRDRDAQASEYFVLLMEVANIETRLAKYRETLSGIEEIQEELDLIRGREGFNPSVQKQVEELWTRRQSRQSDYDDLHKVTLLKEEDFEVYENQIKERWADLKDFTEDDSRSLSKMASDLERIHAELTDLLAKKDTEVLCIEKAHLDLEKFDETKRSLIGLDARDHDDARSYHVIINSSRKRINELDDRVQGIRALIDEINDERKNRARHNKMMAIALAVTATAWFVIVGVFLSSLPILYVAAALLIGICLLVSGAVYLGLFLKPQYYRKKESTKAQTDIEEQSVLRSELENRLKALEGRLEKLALKTGLLNSSELLKRVEDYMSFQAAMKGLDVIDETIHAKKAALSKISDALNVYFQKAGREKLGINPSTTYDLSDDVNRFVEEMRILNTTFSVVRSNRQQLEFLSSEIKNVEEELSAIFERCHCSKPNELESGYHEFKSRSKAYDRLQSLEDELLRMNYGMSSQLTFDDLPHAIERLERDRHKIWLRMQELVNECPEIAEMEPPRPEEVKETLSWSAAQLVDTSTRAAEQKLKAERDELIVKYRVAMEHYDDQYLSIVEAMDELEHKLNNMRRTKAALELAVTTLKEVSKENYSDWSAKLNEITVGMLDHLGFAYKLRFNPDLSLSVEDSASSCGGASEPIKFDQLSVGVKEKLHLLARMVVSKFMSSSDSLPIILDEPFSETDDENFLQMVKFILSTLVPHHQVIMFSCHQMRHQWLLDRLNPDEKDRIEFCQRESLLPATP